jgi:hypothetical protein
MTAARRNGSRSKAPVLLAGLVLALAIAATTLVGAATTERVVLDRRTGLAIHGFDPVAYFTDAVAAAGDAGLEFRHVGAVWRFLNPGNRAAFADRPDIYMPQFGGYDPIVLAHAVATPGHPQLWLIADDRLFMFHSAEARAAFAADPRGSAERAAANWPKVLPGLVP